MRAASANRTALTLFSRLCSFLQMKNYDSTHHGALNYHDFSKTFKDPDEVGTLTDSRPSCGVRAEAQLFPCPDPPSHCSSQELDIYQYVNAQLNPAGLQQEPLQDVSNVVIPQQRIKELYE